MKLNGLVGLADLKEKARICARSSYDRRVPFPHTLLHGIGGTGKTQFARAVAEELGYHFVEVEAAVFKTREGLVRCLTDSCAQAVSEGRTLLFFIDEIHRLGVLQETLYYPMREYRITSTSGCHLDFPPFSLFGATTRMDKLDENSFVESFVNQWLLTRYDKLDID